MPIQMRRLPCPSARLGMALVRLPMPVGEALVGAWSLEMSVGARRFFKELLLLLPLLLLLLFMTKLDGPVADMAFAQFMYIAGVRALMKGAVMVKENVWLAALVNGNECALGASVRVPGKKGPEKAM
jgi:hypothetical protein